MLIIKIILISCFFVFSGPLSARSLVLTLDDAPMETSALFTKEEKIKKIIQHLDAKKVQAIFFCVGQSIEESEGVESLQWLSDKGHLLANHSYHHWHTSKLSISEFITEILSTEALLSRYATSVKIFRFPSLDYGARRDLGGSEQKRKEVFIVLESLGYLHGYVTLNTFDWYLDQRMQEALVTGKNVQFNRLKEVYLSLLDEWIEVFAKAAFDTANREIVHTLLLHENDLNALFLGDVIDHLKKRGWEILPAQEGFKEKALQHATPGDLYYQRFGHSFKTPPSFSLDYINQKLTEGEVFTSN